MRSEYPWIKCCSKTIFGSKKGLPTHTANRFQRWGTILLNYDFDMEFLTSKNPGEKVYFRKYSNNQMSWELGRIMQRIGNMVYMVEGPSGTHKRHLNQLRKRYSEDSETTPPEPEEVIESFYDTFELEPPQTTPDQRRSLRKRKRTELIEINPKKKCY